MVVLYSTTFLFEKNENSGFFGLHKLFRAFGSTVHAGGAKRLRGPHCLQGVQLLKMITFARLE